MRVALVTHGTRGDAQPLVALGAELRRRGHEVVLGLPVNLVELGRRVGFAVQPLAIDSQEFLESPEGLAWLSTGRNRAFSNHVMAVNHAHATELDDNVLAACEAADAVVSGFMLEDRASVIAERMGIPLLLLHSAPLRRNGVVASPVVTARSFPLPGLNALTHTIFERVWWHGMRSDVNALRARLGLPPTRRTTPGRVADRGTIEIQAYSRHLVPGLETWEERRPLVGTLDIGEHERALLGETGLEPDLDAWISRGEPPAYFGFGSMPILDPQATLDMIARVATTLGQRAVVSAGWSGIDRAAVASDEIRLIGSVDHDALLPRCRVAVHHGGAGTTAAVARAGIPALVCSVFADQPFWGAQLTRLGVGSHLRFCKLDEQRLLTRLRELLDPDVVERAQRLGAALRSERPAVPRAADLVEGEIGSGTGTHQ